jgi:hypothetical protein
MLYRGPKRCQARFLYKPSQTGRWEQGGGRGDVPPFLCKSKGRRPCGRGRYATAPICSLLLHQGQRLCRTMPGRGRHQAVTLPACSWHSRPYPCRTRACKRWQILVPSLDVSPRSTGCLKDAPHPSRSVSPLPNVERCWRGNGPQPSQRGVLGAAGLSYSSPMACRSPTLPLRSASAAALSTNGCSGFCMRACRGWPINPGLGEGARETLTRKRVLASPADLRPVSSGLTRWPAPAAAQRSLIIPLVYAPASRTRGLGPCPGELPCGAVGRPPPFTAAESARSATQPVCHRLA